MPPPTRTPTASTCPALFVAMGLFGGLFAGYGLLERPARRHHRPVPGTPVSRTGLLLGRALMHVCLNVVQAVIITLVALPFGLRVRLATCSSRCPAVGDGAAECPRSVRHRAVGAQREQPRRAGQHRRSADLAARRGAHPARAGTTVDPARSRSGTRSPGRQAGCGRCSTVRSANAVVWQGALIMIGLAAVSLVWSSHLFNREVSLTATDLRSRAIGSRTDDCGSRSDACGSRSDGCGSRSDGCGSRSDACGSRPCRGGGSWPATGGYRAGVARIDVGHCLPVVRALA